MAQVTRSTKVGGGTTLQSNTLARAADVEIDMLTLFNAHNNHDTGTSKWTAIVAEGVTTVPLTANNSTGTQNIANFQDNGTNVLSIADGGATTILAAGASAVPLTVNNGTSTGSILIVKDNGSAVLTVADGGAISLTGEVTITTASKGIVVTTPNGTNTYRIAVNNDGELTTELVS